MQINLQVTLNDETVRELTAKAADIVAFEEHFDISVAKFETNFKFTHLCYLAWHVDKRTGGTKEEFTKWLESVDSVEALEPKK